VFIGYAARIGKKSVTLLGNDARIGKSKTVTVKYMKTLDVTEKRNGRPNRNRLFRYGLRNRYRMTSI
jgi:hypothetical protein